jgi:hypothetical protein
MCFAEQRERKGAEEERGRGNDEGHTKEKNLKTTAYRARFFLSRNSRHQ